MRWFFYTLCLCTAATLGIFTEGSAEEKWVELGRASDHIALRAPDGKYLLMVGFSGAKNVHRGSVGASLFRNGAADNVSGDVGPKGAKISLWFDEKPFLFTELAPQFEHVFSIEFPYRPETLRLSFDTAGSVVNLLGRISEQAVIAKENDTRKYSDTNLLFTQGVYLPPIKLMPGQAKLLILEHGSSSQTLKMLCAASEMDGPIKLAKLIMEKDNDRMLSPPIVLSQTQFHQPVFRVYMVGNIDRLKEASGRRYALRWECETMSGRVLTDQGLAKEPVSSSIY